MLGRPRFPARSLFMERGQLQLPVDHGHHDKDAGPVFSDVDPGKGPAGSEPLVALIYDPVHHAEYTGSDTCPLGQFPMNAQSCDDQPI